MACNFAAIHNVNVEETLHPFTLEVPTSGAARSGLWAK